MTPVNDPEVNDIDVVCAYHDAGDPSSRQSVRARSAHTDRPLWEGLTMDAAQIAGSEGQHEAQQLSTRDREILAFERQWWKYAGAKEQAVRELFDMSATRYYQVLNTLIDSPEALAFDPMLVKRLRRMRATRQRARSARRLGIRL
jgi:Protein of unknown function (DUF3263)